MAQAYIDVVYTDRAQDLLFVARQHSRQWEVYGCSHRMSTREQRSRYRLVSSSDELGEPGVRMNSAHHRHMSRLRGVVTSHVSINRRERVYGPGLRRPLAAGGSF